MPAREGFQRAIGKPFGRCRRQRNLAKDGVSPPKPMKQKKTPMRMCLGCREMKPKPELIRVVRAPDGTVSLDPVGKKPGRGAYVCRDAQCLSRAIRQKQLERQLEVPLGEETAAALRAALDALSAGEAT